MRQKRPSRIVPLCLFLLCIWLGYLVYVEINVDAEAIAGMQPVGAPPDIARLPPRTPPSAPPLKRYKQTLERPAFHVSRRAPTIAPGKPPPPPNAIAIKLVGIIITPDEQTALIREPRSSEITELSIGQTLQGWVLEEVMPDRIILKSGDRRETYRLETEFR